MESLDIYKSILSISEKIYYTYIALAQEEIKNGINSIRYKELLKSVNILKSIEDSIYKKIEKNTIKNKEYVRNLLLKLYQDSEEEIDLERTLHSPERIIFNDNLGRKAISMRISNKLSSIFIKFYIDDANIDKTVYFIGESTRDKYFLDFLDELIVEQKSSYLKNVLINSKYEYAFINCGEYDNQKPSEDYDELISAKNFLELTKYIKKMSVMSEKSFFHPINSRRILLTFTYVRSLVIQMREEEYRHLKETIDIMLEHKVIKDSYGTRCFIAMLDYYYEDKRKYSKKGYSFKRKI